MARLFALLALALLALPAGAQKNSIDSLFANPMQGLIDEAPKSSAAEVMRKQRQDMVANRQHASGAQLAQLSQALDAGMYPEVQAFIRAHAGEPAMVQWALARASRGDVPMMWELAELYAFDNADEQAVKWAYSAILGVLQERSLCLQNSNQGPTKIAAEHPRVVALARANAHWTREAKAFAMRLLSSPLDYPSPEPWLCRPYGPKQRPNARSAAPLVTYDPIYFPILRARARNKLRVDLAIPGGPEQEPPMPAAPARRR